MEWIIVAIIVLIILIRNSIKVVNIMEAHIVERFGKYHKTIENGINFINPFVDKIKAKINLKVQVVKVPCKIITQDYKECLVTVSAFTKIMEPKNFYYNNIETSDISNCLKICATHRISSCMKKIMREMDMLEIRNTEKIKFKEMIDENIHVNENGLEIDDEKLGYKIYDVQIDDISYTK